MTVKADPERLLTAALRAQAVNSSARLAPVGQPPPATGPRPAMTQLSLRLVLLMATTLGLATGVAAAAVTLV